MFESIAIVLQSIDEHPDQNLAPLPGSLKRATYYQWALFAAREVDPAIMMVFYNTMRPLEAMRPAGSQHNPAMAEKGRYEFGQRAAILSNVLDEQDYILGDNFTGADIIVGHSCFMATTTGLIDYRDRLKQRPAAQRVYG